MSEVTAEQSAQLWAFARGDLEPLLFERWFLAQRGLGQPLGADLHWDLTSASYRDKDTVFELRTRLRAILSGLSRCFCASIRDLDVIHMGGEVDAQDKIRSDHIFENFDEVLRFGPPKWWLFFSKCRVCSSVWLIAQDERIYDDWYLARLDEGALNSALKGEWPIQFATYEIVLAAGRKLSTPPRFLEANAWALVDTVSDLERDRPEISDDEIGWLLGISQSHAAKLRKLAGRQQR